MHTNIDKGIDINYQLMMVLDQVGDNVLLIGYTRSEEMKQINKSGLDLLIQAAEQICRITC